MGRCSQACSDAGRWLQVWGFRCCENPSVLWVAGWIPTILICIFLLWSYYAYVIDVCVKSVGPEAQFGVYLAIYHILLILLAVSYYRAIFTQPAQVPAKYRLPQALAKQLERGSSEAKTAILFDFARTNFASSPPQMREYTGSLRYCDHCQLIKPDRAHHCSTCGYCILKMDHHCPWINNCSSYSNYKYFIIFLLYGSAFTLFLIATDLQYAIPLWKDMFGFREGITAYKFHISFIPVVAFVFFCMTGGFFLLHLGLIWKNQSTLESMGHPIFAFGHHKRAFDMGWRKNAAQVFGTSPFLWLLPIFTSEGDGCVYPTVETRPLEYWQGTPRNNEQETVPDSQPIIQLDQHNEPFYQSADVAVP